MAARYMAFERPGHSWQPTILVHDAYMRMVEQKDRNWQNHNHFFAVAAQQMRWMLIDYAKKRKAIVHGGGQIRLDLDDVVVFSEENQEEWLTVDMLLERLKQVDPELAQIVELKYFAGLTREEIGEVIGKSVKQVGRDWEFARQWMLSQLTATKPDDTRDVAANQTDHD